MANTIGVWFCVFCSGYLLSFKDSDRTMAVSYDKEQRAYAKEHKMDLCTVAARGITTQGPARTTKARLIQDCALHTMCLKEDLPFECIKDIKLPPDVANLLEDFKLSIVRHRASGFVDIDQQDFLSVLNALRHFVAMPKKGTSEPSDSDTSGAKLNAEKQWEATAKEQLRIKELESHLAESIEMRTK